MLSVRYSVQYTKRKPKIFQVIQNRCSVIESKAAAKYAGTDSVPAAYPEGRYVEFTFRAEELFVVTG